MFGKKEGQSFTFKEMSSSHMNWMRLIALIPFEGRTYSFVGTRILKIYFHISNIIYAFMWHGYGVVMLVHKNLEIDYLSEVLMVSSVISRYAVLHMNREKILRLVEACKDIFSCLEPHETLTVRRFERKAHYLRSLILSNIAFTVFIFIVTAIRTHNIAQAAAGRNVTLERKLIFRSPFNITRMPLYAYATLVQMIVASNVPLKFASIETVNLYFVLMTCGFLRVMRDRLATIRRIQNEAFAPKEASKDYLERIYREVLKCAKIHQKIIRFYESINEVLRMVYFFQVFTTIYNMAIGGLKIIQNDDAIVDYTALFLLNFFTAFVCQWSPEQLLTESERFSQAVYFACLESPHFSRNTNWILLMMMMKTHKPMQLTAGGYLYLSIATFGKMAKSAFSFFTVLRTFNG